MAGGYPAASMDAEFGAAGYPTPEPSMTRTKVGDSPTLAPVAVGGGERSVETGASNAGPDGQLRAERPGTNLLLIGSLIFLAVGIGLFGLRSIARRLR
jgi:hypothetical protein